MNGFLIFTKIFRMRALKHIFFFGIFFIGFRAQSQVTVHPMVFAGYEYQNSNFGEVGARFIFLKNDNVLYRVSGSALMGKVNGEFAVLPKIQGDILLNFEKKRRYTAFLLFSRRYRNYASICGTKSRNLPFRNYRFYWRLRISAGK